MKLGTRGSELALWQARRVRALLQEAAGVTVEIVVVTTAGDRDTHTPLPGMPGKGFFTKEIEEALLEGHIDLAVHSLKDLQSVMPEGLAIAAIPERADRRDTLLIRAEAFSPDHKLRLKPGARVGTSSARRAAQLQFHRPDLVIEALRGNVPTRVDKLDEGKYDAILIAAAGLDRLNLALDEFREFRLPEILMVPAPGQGALAVQIRDDDSQARRIVNRINRFELGEALHIEREILRRLEGGCQLALGVAAENVTSAIRVTAFLGTPDPIRPRRIVVAGNGPEDVISTAVTYLKSRGDPVGQDVSVWITREPDRSGAFLASLDDSHFFVTSVPVFVAIEAGDPALQKKYFAQLHSYDWVIFTSQVTVSEFRRLAEIHGASLGHHNKLAAIGRKTAQAMREVGWNPNFVSDVADALSMAEQFGQEYGGHVGKVLFPCGQAASDDLETGLSDGVTQLDRMVCYDMVAHPDLKTVTMGLEDPDAIVFTSAQAAQFLLRERPLSDRTAAVSIGPSTTESLLSWGCQIVYEAMDRSLEGTAEVIRGLFSA